MKDTIAAFLVWLVVTAAVWALISFDVDIVQTYLFYPRSFGQIALICTLLFALPGALTAGMVFAMGARPSAPTLLATTFAALLIIALCMSIAWFGGIATKNPAYARHDVKIGLVVMALIGVAFMSPPLVLISSKITVIRRIWWRAGLMLLLMHVALAAISFGVGRPIPQYVADIAKDMGAHYYFYRNFAAPACLVAIATASATQIGAGWARTYRRHSEIRV
ncbi:hypothetical protein JJJ17_17530 [Paracoccus caeni]|uniref:Uncharacterized protein n=1 Tax=Paracoccus caeni TaxID=657651 RepID=A0A934SH35_9RHOB|nr:hypothetical protein [Paracoccus caeni]MBK4217737.1 hypothetical protein [Paracoccus caeni]